MSTGLSPSRWIAVGVVTAFSAALFQVSFIRILSYVFPFQMIFAVSLVTGAAIFFSGIGALLARSLPWLTPAALLTAAASPAALYAISLFTTRSMTDYVSFGIAVGLCAVPFTLYGLMNGICYRALHAMDRRLIAPLIGLSSVAFFIGLTGAAFFGGAIGIVTLALIAAAALAVLPLRPLPAAVAFVVLAALLVLCGVEERAFQLIAREPALWDRSAKSAAVVGGGWSPYARVDLVDMGRGRLAGMYNGVQYWMTGAPEDDVPFRRALYGTVTGSALVIGTGGGHGLRSLTNASRIEAVELDPLVVSLLKGPLASYNGGIYGRIAEAHAGDGRSYLDNAPGAYDAIIFEAAEVGLSNYHKSFITLENYLYTREAMASAFGKLAPDGALIIIHTDTHVPRERFMKALPSEARFRTFQASSEVPGFAHLRFTTDITVASRDPATLKRWTAAVLASDPSAVDETGRFTASERFLSATAVTDDRPVLYLRDLSQLTPFAVVAFILLAVAFALGLRGGRSIGGFFLLTGVSFMVTQLYIINLLRAAVNGYVETSSIALGVFTLGSAAGALLAARIPARRAVFALVPASFVLVAILSLFPFGALLAVKLALIAVAVFPVAFITGTFFPKGFFVAPVGSGAWYYAIDTVASAGAFLLFYLITAAAGFSYAGLFGLACYLGAGLLLLRM